MIAVHDLCGDGLCTSDAACEVQIPESEQTLHFCEAHGRQLEARARSCGLTITIEWFDRGGE